MRRNIILLLLLAHSIKGFSQVREQLLLEKELQYFTTADDSVKSLIALEKFSLYLSDTNLQVNALKDLERINGQYLRPQERSSFYWNASLYTYLLGEYRKAHYYIEKYNFSSGDSSVTCTLLNLLVQAPYDTTAIGVLLKQAEKNYPNHPLQCLHCLIGLQQAPRAPSWPLYLSALIPGSGLIQQKYYGKGISSLFFHAATAGFIYLCLQQQLYINALNWGLSLGIKFYSGNLRLTQKAIAANSLNKQNQEKEQCRKKMQELLLSYPLNFKSLPH